MVTFNVDRHEPVSEYKPTKLGLTGPEATSRWRSLRLAEMVITLSGSVNLEPSWKR